MKVRKTIYISDDIVLHKLNSEKNQSRYICNLILQDINDKKCYVTEDRVLQLICQYISNNNIQVKNPINTTDIKESILSVLGTN